MVTKEANRERRSTYRFPVPPDQQGALLHWGKDEMPACLMDESAGGFMLLLVRHVEAKIGDKLVLETRHSSCEVEVVRIEESDEGDSVLGLRRIRDIDIPTRTDSAWRVLLDRSATNAPISTGYHAMMVRGLGAALFVALFVFGWGWVTQSGWLTFQAAMSSDDSSRHSQDDDSSSILSGLNRLSSLTSPSTTDRLHLNTSQQLRIRDALNDANRNLRRIGSQAGNSAEQQRQTQNVVRNAQAKIMGTLNSAQQKVWRQLQGD